jgi:hypothetical protein
MIGMANIPPISDDAHKIALAWIQVAADPDGTKERLSELRAA